MMRRPSKLLPGVAAFACVVACAPAMASSQPARSERIAIEYLDPANSAHVPLNEVLKANLVLERVRDLLTRISWPRTLWLTLKGCDGESNAWYVNARVVVCYEYLEDMWRSASSPRRPSGVSREDAFIGPLVDVFLHEASHALFDLLKIPLLGREEDAADQLATYLMLQFPTEQKRRFILGSAYAYASELRVRSARDLHRRRLEVGRHITFADEHGTPAQRLYNLLCLAYGSDQDFFNEIVERGYLPKERAETCWDEYQQVDFAYHTLITPHIDSSR
jgi:hypothetical protein